MYCMSCGQENADDSRFCIGCGCSLEEQRAQAAAVSIAEDTPNEAVDSLAQEPEPGEDAADPVVEELGAGEDDAETGEACPPAEVPADEDSESEAAPEIDEPGAAPSARMPKGLLVGALALLAAVGLIAAIMAGVGASGHGSIQFASEAAAASASAEASGLNRGVQMVIEHRNANAAYAKLLADIFKGCDSSFEGHPARLGEKDGRDAYGYFYAFAVGNLDATPVPELVVFHSQGAVSEADWCGAQVYRWSEQEQSVQEASSVTFSQIVDGVSFCEASSGEGACARLSFAGDGEADRYLLAEPWDADGDGQSVPCTALVTLDELGGEDSLAGDGQGAAICPFSIEEIVLLAGADGDDLRSGMDEAAKAQEENSYENRKRAEEEAARARHADELAGFWARYNEAEAIANSDSRFGGTMAEMRAAGADHGERLTNLMNEIYEWELGLPGADVDWLRSSQADWQAGLDGAQGAVTDEFNASPYSGNMYGMNLSGERFSRAKERIEELLSYAEGLV